METPIPYADDFTPTYSPCRTIFSGGQWAIPDDQRPKNWQQMIAPRDIPVPKPKVYRDASQIVRMAPKAPRKITAPSPRGVKPRTILVSPGQKFGRWEVVREAQTIGPNRNVLCRCECGDEREVRLANLKNGHSTGCGNDCPVLLSSLDAEIRKLWLDDGCIDGIARALDRDKKVIARRLRFMAQTDELVAARLKIRFRAKRAEVIPGKQYGRLTVIREIEPDKCGRRMVLCKCECGTEKPIRWYSLSSGKSTACSKQRHDSVSATI